MKKQAIIATTTICIVIALIVISWMTLNRLMAVKAIRIDANCTIYAGTGFNSVVLTSPNQEEAIVIDTMMLSSAKDLRQRIHAQKITIINTHNHIDHVQGNSRYPNAYIITGVVERDQWNTATRNAKYPDRMLSVGEELIIPLGAEKVHILNTGRAHSSCDCVVYFEQRKLLATGDLVFVDWHPPYMDPACSVSLWIRALEFLDNKYEVNIAVPGHGAITNKNAILTMKDYFASISAAIDDEARLKSLKARYGHYVSIPFLSGFNKSVSFIRNEMGATR